ncbi:hypothetical protein P186_2140 [Pyrobaculum ferrireducens]|uniref:Uncharacterized protein n=1 Tax=Pyrobaculum ferrireducens TaxID=1104324 RepID=G7VAV4_9CREN|nr:hypothetical protein P186_2140 [Pyrobaculum ferrireducens]
MNFKVLRLFTNLIVKIVRFKMYQLWRIKEIACSQIIFNSRFLRAHI